MIVMTNNKVLSLYDWFLISGVIISNAVYSVMTGTFDILGTLAGVTGVICVVLVAKGSIWNYLFGLVNVSLYAYISYKAALYGDAALNALYYFPMQFIGYWQWRKIGTAASSSGQVEGAKTVKARRFNWKQRAVLAAACTAAVVAVGFILQYLGDPQPFKDSATTVLSIAAQALMALAFMEQWALWIITNVISVAMWTVFAVKGEPHSGVMVIMWVFYLLNSINGFRVWIKLSK